MTLLKICLVGGWCGNLRFIVAEHIEDVLTQAGIQFKLSHQSVWENPVPPRSFDLVLQLLPAFTEAETGCPVINVKPLLADTNHHPTNGKIMQFIECHSQVNAGED